MENPIIEKTVYINATSDKVWRVFTDPTVTIQMGGEYVTTWQVGGSFGWKGQNGQLYTNGVILEIEPKKMLKHNLLELNDKDKLLSVVTYEFKEDDGKTIITATEEIKYAMTENQLKEASEGWDFALQSLKDVAEKI